MPPMMKILPSSVVLASLVLATTPALAGGSKNSIGVGAEFELSGVRGATVSYDAGQFHVTGLVGINDPDGPDNGEVDVAGGFYWHVGTTAMSDFGLGARLGMQFSRLGNPTDNNQTNIFLEPGFQIRAFIASNVALSFTGGFMLGVGDDKTFAFGGDITGDAGVTYYFF